MDLALSPGFDKSYSIEYFTYVNNNKEAIELSTNCICVYCIQEYPASSVIEYTADNCAICPECGVDSVIPDASKVVTHDELYQWHINGF